MGDASIRKTHPAEVQVSSASCSAQIVQGVGANTLHRITAPFTQRYAAVWHRETQEKMLNSRELRLKDASHNISMCHTDHGGGIITGSDEVPHAIHGPLECMAASLTQLCFTLGV